MFTFCFLLQFIFILLESIRVSRCGLPSFSFFFFYLFCIHLYFLSRPPQIDCISLLLEANPRAQQTHISFAQMMNLYMKSKSLYCLTDHIQLPFHIAHICLFHLISVDFMVHFFLKLLCRFWSPQSGNAVQILLQTEQKTKGKSSFLNQMAQCFHHSTYIPKDFIRNSYFTY